MTLKVKFFLSFVLGVGFMSPLFAFAAISIENLEGTAVKGDFVVGPGKTEVTINPGEEKIVNIIVTNRMGVDRVFNLEVEDFAGSSDIKQPIVLLGDERGPYSLRDYLILSEYSFVLKHGERATVPVKVSIPPDAEAGGRYGSVVISTATTPDKEGKQKASGSTALITRIGTLFFVTVPGDVKKSGVLKEFNTVNGKKLFSSGKIDFQILYENTGNIHLSPYGEIRVRNILGKEVGRIIIDPWFAMPKSVRLREVGWDRKYMLGLYTAELSVNRGYDDIIDSDSIRFFVFPWKIAMPALIVLVLILIIIRWFASKFEIRKK